MKVSKKRDLYALVLSHSYAKTNCYISQIISTLGNQFNLKLVTLNDASSRQRIDTKGTALLSLLQLRMLVVNHALVNKFTNSSPLMIYDQDPWESFMDKGSIRGAYSELTENMNVKVFLNTSHWWSEFLKSRGFNSSFVQMGILPEYCGKSRPWNSRKLEYFFQGSLHEYRKVFFSELSNLGVSVNVRPSIRYKSFLKNLRDAKFHIHTSHPKWTIDGSLHAPNCCWIKDIEAASQGCFSIRSFDTEFVAQNLHDLPTLRTFNSVEEIPFLLEDINRLNDLSRDKMIIKSKAIIRSRYNWESMATKISEFLES